MNIIISPHLDDAVFSLGATIAENPDDFLIVTVFAGVPWPAKITAYDRGCGFADSLEAMSTRKTENRNALEYLGVHSDNIINLYLLDNQYSNDRPQPREMIEVAIETAIRDIVKFRERPEAIYSPLALTELQYRHIDHIRVFEAMAGVDFPEGIAWRLYADQPYYHLSMREDYTIDALAMAEKQYGSRLSQKTSRFYDAWKKKMAACKLYESQFTGNIEAMLQEPIERTFQVLSIEP